MKKIGWLAIVFNLAIVILEIIGLVLTVQESGHVPIEFYTEDSNLLILVVSSLYLYFALAKKKMPKWLVILKQIATVGLAVTFLVVILILAPMYEFNYGYLLFHNTLLYYHTLCPLLGVVTFLWCDQLGKLPKKISFYGLAFTICYAIVMIVLNLLRIVNGPYPFLKVYEQSIMMSVVWTIVILGLAYIISAGLAAGYKRIRRK